MEKLHDYERNENTLPPALSHALIAGSCLCFASNSSLYGCFSFSELFTFRHTDTITPKLPKLSSDYKNGRLVD